MIYYISKWRNLSLDYQKNYIVKIYTQWYIKNSITFCKISSQKLFLKIATLSYCKEYMDCSILYPHIFRLHANLPRVL